MTDDVTYTDPKVLAAAARGESWADPETNPARIDWTARQAAALIPFQVVDGRPVNPHAPTKVRYGRNRLGHWGEQVCADAVVTLTDTHGGRWLLMIERAGGDGTSGWAVPGGYVDPGEDPETAARRELLEETGLLAIDADWTTLPARYMPDPRCSDEAWMVSVPTRVRLGVYRPGWFPCLIPQPGEVRRAVWVPADLYADLVWHLTGEYGGQVFAAHVPLLMELLDGGSS
ncbi:NUDIX hydrolase [Micromonospora sp. WMMD1102]|uniref:NUDIX hydrolase n=1 Tax=Micromonospora sp. WMMD1102 TaxID=3016105 RepID=UPI0024158BCF|nr:NUDIX hydrolase [Micromonospora sp. WMMD1102]MDG4792070.1 NUDIX hydrolase [Micromonospora sp. WMMD1102]